MFRKLRNQFLWLCMILTSLIILSSFAAIYWTTANIEDADEAVKLQEIFDRVLQSERTRPAEPGDVYVESITMTQYAPSFALDIDADGTILNVHENRALAQEVYRAAAVAARANPDGQFARLGDRLWRYAADTQMNVAVSMDASEMGSSAEFTIDEGGAVVAEHGGWEETAFLRAAFLDVTAARAARAQLRTTLGVVAAVVLALMFCVSLLFSARAIRPIEQAWARQKQFIANASHELKTPLTIIASNLGVLAANGDETIESQMKWIDRIQSGCDRMSGLIQELLRLARMDAETAAPRRKPEDVSMSEAVRGMLAEETARIQSRGLRLSADIAPDVTVEGDRAKISQLVSILLDNAIKYADEGGCIDIKLTKSARYAEYRVKNSGPGIAAEDLPMIFERFYRANRAREHEDGSFGLGLSVAKMIAEQFGGRITAESVPGEATSFAVVLPLRAEGRARRVRKIDNA